MNSGSPGPGGDAGAPPPVALFGLEGEEAMMLRQVFGDLAAGLGLDGDPILDSLGRGEPLVQALGLPPRITDVLYGRAHTWFAAGRMDRAETLFRALCILDSTGADYWVAYGICLHGREARAEAGLAFATAAALQPDWAVPHFHAAQVDLAEARWERAADHLAAFQDRAGANLPATMRRDAARQQQAMRLRETPRTAGAMAP